MTRPEYCKKSRKRGWFELVMGSPFTFLSSKSWPSLALVSPSKYTFPRDANLVHWAVKSSLNLVLIGRGWCDPGALS